MSDLSNFGRMEKMNFTTRLSSGHPPRPWRAIRRSVGRRGLGLALAGALALVGVGLWSPAQATPGLSRTLTGPASLDLGDVGVGATGTRELTLVNDTEQPWITGAAYIVGPRWSIAEQLALTEVPPGARLVATIRFTPQVAGPDSAEFTIVGLLGGVTRVSLTGKGVAGAGKLSAPSALDVGDVQVGSTAQRTITVSNTGDAPVTVASTGTNGRGWSATGPAQGSVIPAGGGVQVTVRFTPEVPGPGTGVLTLVDGLGQSTRVDLTGRAWREVLTGASLAGTSQVGRDLSDSLLAFADLSGTNSAWIDLTRADLTGASLAWSNLTRADLTGADLTGADLTGADLSDAELTGTCHTSTTRWPAGYTPPTASCRNP